MVTFLAALNIERSISLIRSVQYVFGIKTVFSYSTEDSFKSKRNVLYCNNVFINKRKIKNAKRN